MTADIYPDLMLRWLVGRSGRSPYELVNISEFAQEQTIPFELAEEAVRLLEHRGHVLLAVAFGPTIHARVTTAGLQHVDRLEADLRSTSARFDHALTLLMKAADTEPSGQLQLAGFIGTATFHGDHLTVDEVLRAVRYLHDHGLAFATPEVPPQHLTLTTRGWDCALSGKTVRTFVNDQNSASPVFNQHIHAGGTGAQGVNVTQKVTNTTGLSADDLIVLIRELRNIAPQLAPDKQEEFVQDVEILEDTEQDTPARLSAGERIKARLIDSGIPALISYAPRVVEFVASLG
ncbi:MULTISPECIES: hypothetical protein [unclassified Streptomyces]|uniref:hypothetical protein n=1 Tax=unclassified Streptomyces TaxID=2593676 RepID=UPI00369C94F5